MNWVTDLAGAIREGLKLTNWLVVNRRNRQDTRYVKQCIEASLRGDAHLLNHALAELRKRVGQKPPTTDP